MNVQLFFEDAVQEKGHDINDSEIKIEVSSQSQQEANRGRLDCGRIRFVEVHAISLFEALSDQPGFEPGYDTTRVSLV